MEAGVDILGRPEEPERAKERALTSLEELRKMIEESKARGEKSKNSCWWDTKPCLNYSKIDGFQEAGTLCNGCFRVDRERFVFILGQVVPEFVGSVIAEAEEEAEKENKAAEEEAREEAWQEINEEIQELIVAALK